ncbi:MAG: hypothetical protein US36_C0014G0006 [Candidatus Wolfebacteria bacterium GW2011_GWC1_37_10]|uniref:Uncharacterized protein n=1 Tax=Candidatus Wolfebacteria bacterium GW2011_GWC1_37_10 TaxID=1619010 RepID=A0A0G0J0S3_9BACT|nr:MAG: hypothetical protein US36_C0014G0006 [Candidatus Wolfebacteria bacterium GW2011_GWC1_37_10]
MENMSNNIKITVDNDAKNYEANSFLKKTINLFLFFYGVCGGAKDYYGENNILTNLRM